MENRPNTFLSSSPEELKVKEGELAEDSISEANRRYGEAVINLAQPNNTEVAAEQTKKAAEESPIPERIRLYVERAFERQYSNFIYKEKAVGALDRIEKIYTISSERLTHSDPTPDLLVVFRSSDDDKKLDFVKMRYFGQHGLGFCLDRNTSSDYKPDVDYERYGYGYQRARQDENGKINGLSLEDYIKEAYHMRTRKEALGELEEYVFYNNDDGIPESDFGLGIVRAASNEAAFDGCPAFGDVGDSVWLREALGEKWTNVERIRRRYDYNRATENMTGDGYSGLSVDFCYFDVTSESGKKYEVTTSYNRETEDYKRAIVSKEVADSARREYGKKMSAFAAKIGLPFQVAKGLYESGYDKDRTEAFEMADIIKGAKLNIENGDPLEVEKHYSHELKNCGIDRRKGALCAILVPELTVLHRDEEDGNHKEDSDTKMILFEKIQNMGQKESAALADYLLPGEANR